MVIPQPETVFAAGDEVLALASGPVERALRDAVVGAAMPGGIPTDSIDGVAGVRLVRGTTAAATAARSTRSRSNSRAS